MMNITQIKNWRNSPQLEMIFSIKCSHYGTEQLNLGTIIDILLEEINKLTIQKENKMSIKSTRTIT